MGNKLRIMETYEFQDAIDSFKDYEGLIIAEHISIMGSEGRISSKMPGNISTTSGPITVDDKDIYFEFDHMASVRMGGLLLLDLREISLDQYLDAVNKVDVLEERYPKHKISHVTNIKSNG